MLFKKQLILFYNNNKNKFFINFFILINIITLIYYYTAFSPLTRIYENILIIILTILLSKFFHNITILFNNYKYKNNLITDVLINFIFEGGRKSLKYSEKINKIDEYILKNNKNYDIRMLKFAYQYNMYYWLCLNNEIGYYEIVLYLIKKYDKMKRHSLLNNMDSFFKEIINNNDVLKNNYNHNKIVEEHEKNINKKIDYHNYAKKGDEEYLKYIKNNKKYNKKEKEKIINDIKGNLIEKNKRQKEEIEEMDKFFYENRITKKTYF